MYHGALAVLLMDVITMGAMTDAVSRGAAPEPAEGDGGARWERAAAHFAAWRDGDGRAMDALVRLMTPVLWHVVRAYGMERTAAEDVVQTTWMRLVRSQHSIADAAAVSAWLTTTARREAWRVIRMDGRADATEDTDLEPLLPAVAPPEAHVETADEALRLWTAVDRLSDRCRRLLRVIAFEERPDYARLSEDLAMPVGSIGPTRRRCLVKLRDLLDEQDSGELP